jgi:ABC-2 type transport system ATP-binding protein
MIELRNIIKRFGSLTAVNDLSLTIGHGEVFGLLGPNGAGKSTTISIAVGLLHPESGTVNVHGLGPPTDPSVRRYLGVAPQSLAVYDDLSGEENLHFFAKLYSLAKRERKQRVAGVLDMVGLAPRARDRVGGYSGGMKRRLNLAVALLHDPPILLLDEPTAGVDPQSRHSIIELVKELAGSGRTIVYTTHYMEEAAKLCSRIGVIDHGQLLASGTVDQLVRAHGGHTVVTIERHGTGPESQRGEERITTDDPVREIARVMSDVRTSADISGVRIDRPDLESVFLALTGRSLRD